MRKFISKDICNNKINTLMFRVVFRTAAAIAMTLFPAVAYAQPITLGSMMCSISANIGPLEPLMDGIAYIAGAILIGSGLFQLIKHNDGRFHHEHPLHRPIAHMVGGAALLALPGFLGWAIVSLWGYSTSADFGGGLSACIPIVDAAGTADSDHGLMTNVGLDGLMVNLVMNIKSPMVFMLSCLSILIGVFLVIRGLVKGAKFGTDPKAHSVPNILANIIIGTIVYTIGMSMNTVMATVFGSESIAGPGTVLSTIAYDFGDGTLPFQEAVYAALSFFQMIGMIAFIRGWLILKDAVEGQGQKTVSQGLTHILGGVLAVNIYGFLQVLDTTFGTGFLS